MELMRRHGGSLRLYARQFFARSDDHAAEEVVQDVFFRLSRLSEFPENLPGWLFRSARNGAISLARSQKRREKREHDREPRPYFLPDPAGTLEIEELAFELEKLDAESREIITMHIWGGLSFGDIAGLLEKPKTTVWRRYEEALARLRNSLDGGDES